MEVFATCCDGGVLSLPALLAWRLSYTVGIPCDSFSFRFIWKTGLEQALARAVTITARENGETVFSGVIDEYESQWTAQGGTLLLSGRGLAARLLDNETVATEYQTATLADILRDHVTPYGIRVAKQSILPAVPNFSVSSGSSEWQVLYEFARYHGNVTPRFDRTGNLLLTTWENSTKVVLDDRVPVTELHYRYRRYGVLSEILVQDKTRQTAQRVENRTFLDLGGQCRRVLTMPGKSNYQTMRYSGQFQLDRSKSELIRAELTVAALFLAWPGDLVTLNRTGLGYNGTYRVLESTVEADEDGGRTRLTLGQPDAVI